MDKTTGYTMAVYKQGENGYEWYAGRYNECTGQGELRKDATLYYGSAAQMNSISSAILATGKFSRVEIVPWWM